MPHDERDESGDFVPTYAESDFLAAVRELDEPTTGDVAESVGCTRQNALYRLNRLEEEGKVRFKRKGNYKLWFPAET